MAIPGSYKVAGGLVVLVAAYFGFGTLTKNQEIERVSDEVIGSEEALFNVVATRVSPADWQETVNVRGRTKALRKVVVRSETAGTVSQTPASIGDYVKTGDVLCRLKVDARQSQLNQAKAALTKAKLDHQVAEELKKEGLGSDNALATAKAALDQAEAIRLSAKLALDNTSIAAPYDGIFDERMAEAGDFLAVGDPCGVVIQQSPFLVVGAVSERQVSKIKAGDKGVATLATGEVIEGKVRFVASGADNATRTFDVELEVPNEKATLRDGVTAQFKIFAHRRSAHRVKRSALVLNDDGEVGVRTIDDRNIVNFIPVRLLGESVNGIYVDGLQDTVSIITRGQEYVSAGQKVGVTFEEAPSRNATSQDNGAAESANLNTLTTKLD